MDEGATVGAFAVKSAAFFETMHAEIFEKGAHDGQVGRGKTHMRNILDLDNRHSGSLSDS